MLHRLLCVAVIAGLFAGLASTAVQELWAVPLILEAESYENVAHDHTAPTHDHAKHAVAAAVLAGRDHAGHAHDASAWAPADGAERRTWTALTNAGLGIGAGLLLAALWLLRGHADVRSGLAWGAGAFVAVSLAPALGLPPELPGTAAAPLADRQAWWLFTVAMTAAALALAMSRRSAGLRLAALPLALLPHLLGAPQPDVHATLAPAALQAEFVAASLLATLVFWLALGAGAGTLYARLLGPAVTGASRHPIEEHTAR